LRGDQSHRDETKTIRSRSVSEPSRASDKSIDKASDATKSSVATPPPEDRIVATRHSIKLGGKTLRYTVTCGTMVLKEETEKDGTQEGEKAKATVFFVAYTLDQSGTASAAKRPITYSFNGGPGSSSVWLHLGIAGPKRVKLNKGGTATPPPHRLIDNEYALLDVTDLVFIDPVGTGYSRMVAGETTKTYHNYKRDLESIGEFIRLYTTRYGRWSSPKFLCGESYGTTRAAALSNHLFDRYGMALNGVLLISIALEMQTLRFDHGNDLPPLLFLPTYAATAWHHQKLDRDLQAKKLPQLLAEVGEFAMGEYAAALMQGNKLSGEKQRAIAKKVARYTGLDAAYVERSNLRVNILRFCKELLRSEGKTVGRLDSRLTGVDRDRAGEQFEFDPSFTEIYAAYSSCLNDYVRGDLKFESDLPYEVLKSLYLTWGWEEFSNRYGAVSEPLRQAMSKNAHMKVFVANGYFDFATPHLASDYTFSHLALDASREANIETHYYEAGHMMYIHEPSLAKLSKDLKRFIAQAANT
jgi:carboxypeptidase C (cathepsin A)